MDWQPLDSKMLAAVVYVPETGHLHLPFQLPGCFPFPACPRTYLLTSRSNQGAFRPSLVL
jgi:hypothetical protein